jgi:hypothetical protein
MKTTQYEDTYDALVLSLMDRGLACVSSGDMSRGAGTRNYAVEWWQGANESLLLVYPQDVASSTCSGKIMIFRGAKS